jgi:hypothetical protein
LSGGIHTSRPRKLRRGNLPLNRVAPRYPANIDAFHDRGQPVLTAALNDTKSLVAPAQSRAKPTTFRAPGL